MVCCFVYQDSLFDVHVHICTYHGSCECIRVYVRIYNHVLYMLVHVHCSTYNVRVGHYTAACMHTAGLSNWFYMYLFVNLSVGVSVALYTFTYCVSARLSRQCAYMYVRSALTSFCMHL